MHVEAVGPDTIAAARALLRHTAPSPTAPFAVERLGDDPYGHLGGTPVELVAVEAGEVAGFVFGHVRERFVWEGGAWSLEPLLYFTDLRVAVEHRRRRVAARLVDALAERGVGLGARRGYCLVDEGNEAMLALLTAGPTRMTGGPPTPVAVVGRVVQPRAAERAGGWRLVDQDAVDLSVVCRRRPRWLARPWTLPELRRLCDAHPELRFATPAASPGLPAFAVWDQRRIRRLRGLGHQGIGGWMLAAWRARAWLQGGPAPPGPGAPWGSVEVTLLTDEIDPAVALDVAAGAADGAHLASMLIAGEPPPLPGGTQVTRYTQLVPFGLDGAPPPTPRGAPGVDAAFL